MNTENQRVESNTTPSLLETGKEYLHLIGERVGLLSPVTSQGVVYTDDSRRETFVHPLVAPTEREGLTQDTSMGTRYHHQIPDNLVKEPEEIERIKQQHERAAKMEDTKQDMRNGWENTKQNTQIGMENAKDNAQAGMENAKVNAQVGWENVKNRTESGLENAKVSAQNTLENAKSTTQNGLENAKASAQTGLENAKSTVQTGWENVKDTAETGWENAKEAASSGWETAKVKTQSGMETAKDTTQSGWENVKENASHLETDMPRLRERDMAKYSWDSTQTGVIFDTTGIDSDLVRSKNSLLE